jgi:hypothetical protein
VLLEGNGHKSRHDAGATLKIGGQGVAAEKLGGPDSMDGPRTLPELESV